MHQYRSKRHYRQRGQLLIVAALAMAALVAMVAMTIDVGMLFENRRHFQNSADAMALAGADELPDNPGLAIQKAKSWGTNNGVSSSQIEDLEVRTTSYPNDTLYVQLRGSSTGSSPASWVRQAPMSAQKRPPASALCPGGTT